MSWVGSVQTFTEHPWPKGDGKREENIAGTAPRAGTASVGIMAVSEEEVAALSAELEEVAREKELQKRAYEAKLERLQYEVDLEWLQYGTDLEWCQSETMDRPMLPRLEGPEQSAPTKVALAAEAPSVEVATDTRAFPDTAAPDSSVERAATKLTSAAGPSSKISGGSPRRASTGTLVPLAVRYNNNRSSSSNNDTTATCVVVLLRPFDPGKGCQLNTRRGKAVIGLDLPFDRRKA